MKVFSKFKIKVILLCLVFSGGAFYLHAQSVSIGDLLKNPKRFNKKTVEVQGEMIGEALKGNQGIWFNISEDGKNVGIFSSAKESISQIEYWGSYEATGDLVRIRGAFYKDCPQHQMTGIHLKDLEVVKKGEKRDHPVSFKKKKAAVSFFIMCVVIAIIYSAKRRYARKI